VSHFQHSTLQKINRNAKVAKPIMEYENEINRYYGFQNDPLVQKLSKVDISSLEPTLQLKIGILAAMSDNEEHNRISHRVLSELSDKYENTSPYRILKWIGQFKNGNETIREQIADWSIQHPDNLAFSRISLWTKEHSDDTIKMIGNYVQHLEVFWNDDIAWFKVGKLYYEEKEYERASFSFDEAIIINNDVPDYYVAAARSRISYEQEPNQKQKTEEIAKKLLSKAILLDENNREALTLLIKISTDNKEKYQRYLDTINRK